MSRTLIGLTINGKHYQSIKAVPLYRTVRTYTQHLGPEQHAVLGNLRWVLESSSLVEGEFFVLEGETELLAAFGFEKSPQGFEYWLDVVKKMDAGRLIYNKQRAEFKAALRQRRKQEAEQPQQQTQSQE